MRHLFGKVDWQGMWRLLTSAIQLILDRQSKTLEQAVKEYTRRYGRPPPKGFDDWYVSRDLVTSFIDCSFAQVEICKG
jgi:hypothetical protein